MKDNDAIQRQVNEAIGRGNWEEAVDHAKKLPASRDPWQQLPTASEAGMPDHAVNLVLDELTNPMSKHHKNLPTFVHQVSTELHHPSVMPTTLQRLADAATGHDYPEHQILKHPKFKYSENQKNLKSAADFWSSYEWGVDPSHFAAVKSHLSGKPEEMTDHRGKKGQSHGDDYIGHNGNIYDVKPTTTKSKKLSDVIPHLGTYAEKIQNKILADEHIKKRYIGGKPHIKLYRGLNGDYGKIIRQNVNHNAETHEVDNKQLALPTAPMSSWTSDPAVASQFAWWRGEIPGQEGNNGVVLSKWMPVHDIIHSGQHSVVAGQSHPHEHENEFVVAHPEGKMSVASKEMYFQPKSKGNTKQPVDFHDNFGVVKRGKVRKSEEWLENLDKTIDKAKGEKDIKEKTLNEIQKDTAETWASRALASYKKFEETKDPQWKIDAEEYRHEAVEHASLVSDVYPKLLGEINKELEAYRPQTTKELNEVCKSEDLEKSVKEKLMHLAAAASILGVPYQQAKAPVEVPKIEHVETTQDPGLRPIAYIESRNGANTQHEEVEHGLNAGTRAIGVYGFMPLQVQDTIKHDDVLKQKYGKLLNYHPVHDAPAIEKFLTDHPDVQHELANAHWHRVNGIFRKNKDRAIYAWKYGIHGAATATSEAIKNNPYVQEYHKYKNMLDLEKPYKGDNPLRPIKKSEQLEKALQLSPHVQDVAEHYAHDKGLKLTHDLTPVKINPQHGKAIADAYEQMAHDPGNTDVESAYKDLVNETKDQYKHLLSSGYKFSPIQSGQDNPYPTSKHMLDDVRNNKHLWYYPTEQGFGGTEQHKDHPMLQTTEFTDKHGKVMPANDVFRQVHDIFGHALYGNSFGPAGEHKAYLAHKQMYSHNAGKALASETMGQNNWVNWNSKFGEQNRTNPQKTVYADQKAGLLPKEILNQKWHTDELKRSETSLMKSNDTLIHYSMHPEEVKVIDPKHHGEGAVGQESKRPGRIPRSYYYDTEEDHEPVVTERAKYRYTVKHPGKILDLGGPEAHHVKNEAKNQYGIIEPDRLEEVIHKKGYNGYKNSGGSYPNIVAVFKPLEVESGNPLVNLHHTDILTHNNSMNRSFDDVRNGKKTMSQGPLHVHKTEDGRYKLVDGHHRFAEGLLNGQERFPAEVVSSGYSDYHAIPSESEKFKFQKSDLEKKYEPKERIEAKGGRQRSFEQITQDALADLQNVRNTPAQYGSAFATSDNPRSSSFGATPATLYSYGPHWPVVRILDNQNIAVNTHPYGGQTQSMVDNILKQLPEFFPAHNIIEVNHPDYAKSAQIMRGGEKAIKEHLADAAKNHPDPVIREKAQQHLKLMDPVQKGTKEQREAFIGYDPKQNEQTRLARLGKYLTSVGLTPAPHLNEDKEGGKLMGETTPTALTTTPGEGPTEQQLTHEAAHAIQTPPGMTLSGYQTAIGKPGMRVHDVDTLGRIPPESIAQMGEAGISRRSGLSPFRARPGWTESGTVREQAYNKAKEAQRLLDEGITRFDPIEGKLEYQTTPNAIINARATGDKELADRLRRLKFGKSEEEQEDLEKGAKQRLMPFNPAKDVKREDQYKLSLWTDPLETGHHVGRENIPRLQGNGRLRALHSLHAKTKARWNSQTGEREFLLHRGMSSDEYNNNLGVGKVSHSKKSSWSPKYNTALSFAENYGQGTQDPSDVPGKVLSAWIPASKIHHVPLQTGAQERVEGAAPRTEEGQVLGPFEWGNEHEVIIDPGEYDIAHPDEVLGAHEQGLGKNELVLEDLFKAERKPAEGVTDFVPIAITEPSIEQEGRQISALIKDNKTYKLPNQGLFTSDSFIVGTSPNDAWLVKVQSGNRPGIKAVQNTGNQPTKEAAFYWTAKDVFGLDGFTPRAILGHIVKNGEQIWAAAIRMYPPAFRQMGKANDEHHGRSKGIMRKYNATGMSHMIAFMLYVLGDLDSHGNNYMTDGVQIRLIDHGSSFADMRSEDKSDKKAYVPYILRTEGFKKKMNDADKMSHMPKIPTVEASHRVKQYILSIDPEKLAQVISSYNLDPKPEIARLKIVQHLVKFSEHPDLVLNHLWVSGAPQELIDRYYSKGVDNGPEIR